MSSEIVTDFTSVDSSQDPEFFLRFLDAANKLPTVATSKQLILDGLRLRNGSRVLDLGCGLGDDTFQIAERIGASGRVTGVSREEANEWWTSLAAADRAGTFLYGFTAFIVSGIKA